MKYIFSLVLIFLFAFNTEAQVIPTLITSGTVSPDVASLGKFGNIPVSYTTGIPSITIPVYEINIGKLHLPISLDYHAGGIRVDEVSSSAGTGWALNCASVITRNVCGLADESTAGYLSEPDASTVNQNVSTYAQYLYNVTEGLADATPDIFSYSVNGQSGKFMFNKDQSIFQIPVTNNKIEWTGTSFKITDENGAIYIYDKTATYSFGAVNGVITPSYTNTWHLTKMVDQNVADTIFFNYASPCATWSTERIQSTTYTIGTQPACIGADGFGEIDDVNSYTDAVQLNSYTPYFVSSITWRGGKVVFQNSCDRSDKTTEPRLSEIDVYALNNSSYTQVKKVQLYQSYFFYNSTLSTTIAYSNSDERNYRLRLDSVSFFPVNATGTNSTYKMTYDATPMASRESCAQDIFGFNNGQWSNTNLFSKQLVASGINSAGITIPSYIYIGGSNRDVNESYMKACTIQSIQYPTGGKTIFELEPHKYSTNTTGTVTQNQNCTASEGYTTNASTSFTMPASCTNVRYSIFLSSYNYTQITDRPKATLTDATTGQVVLQITNTTATQDYSSGIIALSLTAGHSYVMNVNIYSTSPTTTNLNRVRGTFDINWEIPTTTIETKSGGGLRIKSITNNNTDGNFISKESYVYGENESGTGTLLTPYNYFSLTSQSLTYRIGCSSYSSADPALGVVCTYTSGHATTVYHSGSLNPVSQFSGSPVLYSTVTKYEQDATSSAINGKTVYTYAVTEDYEAIPAPDVFNKNYVLYPTTWRNGYLLTESAYKSDGGGGFVIKNEKTYTYLEDRKSSLTALQVTATYANLGGCNLHSSASFVSSDLHTAVYSINTGINLLQSIVNTNFDDVKNTMVSTQNFSYTDATHLFPTVIQTTQSNGLAVTENLKYPNNFTTTGNVYSKLISRHITAPVVQDQKLVNGSQTLQYTNNYYDFWSDSKILLPQSVDAQVRSLTSYTKFKFNNYDKYGNILEQQKTNDVKEVTLWGYNNQYPVVKVTGSDYSTVKQYITQSILDNPSSDAALRTELNKIRTALAGTKALVTTYTYSPLIGVTSQTDPSGKTTYYEYDGFGRLKLVRNQEQQIVKHYDYQVQQSNQ